MYLRCRLGRLSRGSESGAVWVERSLKLRTDQGQVHSFCCPPARMKLALSELLLVLWFRRSLLKSAFFGLSTTASVSASPAPFILVHIEWPWITFLELFGIPPPTTIQCQCRYFIWSCVFPLFGFWSSGSSAVFILYLVYHQQNNQLFRELRISF